MDKLATKFREAQFYAHACHNTVTGSNFLELHKFFGKLYGAYESAYDSIIERIIGTETELIDIGEITTEAAKGGLSVEDADADKMINTLIGIEMDLQQMIEDMDLDTLSVGTSNLIAGLADDSESRLYKLKQLQK